jgi:hypothetical protein
MTTGTRISGERPCAVTDDETPVSGNVTRIPQVERPHGETFLFRDAQQAADRRRTAGLLVVDVGLQAFDLVAGRGIARRGLAVSEIVAQV